MNNCFEKLNLTISPDNDIFKDHKNFDYNIVTTRLGTRNSFLQCTVDVNYFKDEPIMLLINKYRLTPKVFKIDPGHCYVWHRDSFRHASFNINLSKDPNYLVMFAHEFPNGLRPVFSFEDYSYFPFTNLVYEPYSAYLVNTQIPHTSINCSLESRYILTFGEFFNYQVESSKNMFTDLEYYQSLVKSLKENNFI